MVIFEAARAICSMRDVTARELTPAVTVLQLFLASSKPVRCDASCAWALLYHVAMCSSVVWRNHSRMLIM